MHAVKRRRKRQCVAHLRLCMAKAVGGGVRFGWRTAAAEETRHQHRREGDGGGGERGEGRIRGGLDVRLRILLRHESRRQAPRHRKGGLEGGDGDKRRAERVGCRDGEGVRAAEAAASLEGEVGLAFQPGALHRAPQAGASRRP